MALVLLVALGLAALKNASAPLSSLVFGAMILVLLTLALGAILRRGPDRPIWIGAALFGWFYLVSFLMHRSNSVYPAPQLFPAIVFAYLIRFINPELQGIPAPEAWLDWSRANIYEHYRQVGQSLTTLTIALTGGVLGRFLTRKQTLRRNPESS
jgi:hypothetical protein